MIRRRGAFFGDRLGFQSSWADISCGAVRILSVKRLTDVQRCLSVIRSIGKDTGS
jgi:hypothetical protein